MEAKAKRGELLAGLQRVAPAAAKKSVGNLDKVCVEAEDGLGLRLSATDLVVGARGAVPAKVDVEGGLALDAKRLLQVVKAFSGDAVRLKSDEDCRLEVSCGRARYKLFGVPVGDVPEVRAPSDSKGEAHLHPADLLDLLGATSFASSDDESRPHLNGVLLELGGGKLRAVATDGQRLALREADVESDAEFSLLAPLAAVKVLTRQLKATDVDAVKLSWRGGKGGALAVTLPESPADFTLTARLTEARFPPYERVIPKEFACSVTADCEDLQAAVGRMGLLSPHMNALKVTLREGALGLSADSPDAGEGEEEVSAEVSGGDDLVIGLNWRYLSQALGAAGGESVTLELNGETDPVKVSGGASGLGVVMPLRL